MYYFGTALTDIGIRKTINQDSVSLNIKNTNNKGQVVLAVVCDGIGGLEHGELASSFVTRSFAEWYDSSLPEIITTYSWGQLEQAWRSLISDNNNKIQEYGNRNGFRIGTTLTAMLIIEDRYMIAQVGDSRAFCLTDKAIQVTKDHNYMNRELERGIIPVNEILSDKRRFRLTRTVGTSEKVVPDFYYGDIKENTLWILCSDGLIRRLSEEELFDMINQESLHSVDDLSLKGKHLIDLVKQRGEKDNISAVMIKVE